MRLGILDTGHSVGKKLLLTMIRVVTGRPAPDVVKTIMYRPEFFGAHMSEVFQVAMRGESTWTVGERELMAAWVSKKNECEF